MATIGNFMKSNTGFKGTINTLSIKAHATFELNEDKRSDNQPDFHIMADELRIGVAWERTGTKGRYISISFEDPSFAPGYYNLFKSGVEHGYSLTFERPRPAKRD